MRTKVFCLLMAYKLIFTATLVFGQYAIKGKLIDEKGQAVSFAAIALKGTQLNEMSGIDGSFKFQNIKPGTYLIQVRSLGYLELNDSLILHSDIEYNPTMRLSNKNLDEVVVDATRVDKNSGMAFSNLEAAEIKKINLGQDAPFILKQLTSVNVNSDAGNGIGYTALRIRGSDGTRINVTINGVPTNDPESQSTYFVNMPDLVSGVNNIQVQRGIGTSGNGAGAFGASINFQTNAMHEKAYANLITTAGSYNSIRNTLSAGTGLLNQKFTLDARASLIKSNGYIDRASSDLKSYYLSAGYYGEKSVIKFINFCGFEKTYQAWYYVPEDSILDGNRTYNPAGAYTNQQGGLSYFPNETDNYKQNNFQLHFIHQVNNRFHFNLTAFYTKGLGYFEQYKQDQSFQSYGLNNIITPKGDTITQTDLVRRLWLNNDLAGGIFNFNFSSNRQLMFILGGGYNTYFGQHYGTLVWEQYASNSEMNQEYNYNTGNKNDGNVYLKTNYKPLSSVNIFLDLQLRGIDYRYLGYVNNSGDQQMQNQTYLFFNPKVGFSYNLNAEINLYTSLAKASKEPNRDDFIQSSPDNRPKPEEMVDLEMGLKYQTRILSGNLNFFYMDYKNQLVLNGEVNDVGAYNRVNVNHSYRRGIELELQCPIGKLMDLSANIALSENKIKAFTQYYDSSNADYSVYVQTQTNYENTNISFSPEAVGSLMWRIKPFSNFMLSLSAKGISRQYLDNTQNNSRSIDPYQVVDLNINYLIKSRLFSEISLMLVIYNLLNTPYETNGYTYSYYYNSSQLSTFNNLATAAPLNFLAGINLKF